MRTALGWIGLLTAGVLLLGCGEKVDCKKLDKLGMVMDFREVKGLVEELLDDLGHRHLNELDDFVELNPTTENIARILYQRLSKRLPAGIAVEKVSVWESDDSGAAYRE